VAVILLVALESLRWYLLRISPVPPIPSGLAYPVATPTRPRVLGSIAQPKDVSSISDPPGPVNWVNASGTKVIGEVNDLVITFPGTSHSIWSNTGYVAVVGGGTVRPFTALTNYPGRAAW
jgi:hypothetical protein